MKEKVFLKGNDMIREVAGLYFSATGNTKRVTERIAKRLSGFFGCPVRYVSFTLPGERENVISFGPDTLAVIGMPTYAGKLPNLILPAVKEKLEGNGTIAVPVVTYGNRSFDNSLAELAAVLSSNGFVPVSAAAFACRHAFTDLLAPGRPSEEDLAAADRFAAETAGLIKDALQNGGKLPGKAVPDPGFIPGDADAPYYVPKGTDGQPAKFLKAKPKTDPEKCTKCGLCAKLCPMGSIDGRDYSLVSGICIKCQACVRECPEKAKYFDDPAFLSHVSMLEQSFSSPKEDRFFYPAKEI